MDELGPIPDEAALLQVALGLEARGVPQREIAGLLGWSQAKVSRKLSVARGGWSPRALENPSVIAAARSARPLRRSPSAYSLAKRRRDDEIRGNAEFGATRRELAEEYGLDASTISRILASS